VIYNRNLASIQHKLLRESTILEDAIRQRLAAGRPLSVLEIGCGQGIALMELALRFRHAPVTFHAINKDYGEPLAGPEDLVRGALRLGLAAAGDLQTLTVPQLAFYDATQLRFADDALDVIYASSVVRYIPRKIEFIEEVCRALKPGGIALLRLSSGGWDYPYGLAVDDDTLTPHPSRLVLRHRQELIPLEAYFALVSRDGYRFDFINSPACVLRIEKLRAATPALGLRFNSALSGPMQRLSYIDKRLGLPKGGSRSVYDVREEHHRELHTRGLLDREALQPRPDVACPATATQPADADDPFRGLEKRLRRLSKYRIGQRVVVKIARQERAPTCVVKLKMDGDSPLEHLEGELAWLDARRKLLGVLGTFVHIGGIPPVDAEGRSVTLSELRAGMLVKVDGQRQAGAFAARKVIVEARPAHVVEQVHGRIQEIDHTQGILMVAGFAAMVTPQSKIDEVDRR
jgi:SAM-dependent methyltransferase